MTDVIPGTSKIIVSSTPVRNGDELFSFSILEPTNPQYLEKFITLLDSYLPEVILPRKIKEAHESDLRNGLTAISVLDKARSYLQKNTEAEIWKSGDLGQIILHLFMGKVLKANKLVSKFIRRETIAVAYRGLDSLYGYSDSTGNFYMLAGEAKLYKDIKEGLKSANTSMQEFWQDDKSVSHEINIASDEISNGLTEENLSIHRALFIKDSAEHSNLKYKNIIFVGYDSAAFCELVGGTKTYEEFCRLVNDELNKCLTEENSGILANGKISIFCFLPLELVAQARKVFAEHNNLIIA